MKKSEDGRKDCMLCPENTSGDAIFIFFDPKREPADRVVRGHLKCLQNYTAVAFEKVEHWDEN